MFDFENAHWVCKKTEGGLSSWTFCHATKRGDKIYVVGAADGSVGAADGSDDNVFLEVTSVRVWIVHTDHPFCADWIMQNHWLLT